MQLWRYIYPVYIVDCVPVCVCLHWLSWCICKYIVAQNLTLHGNINCQGYRNVSNIVCFYLMAHCILGVVVCLKGGRVAARGLHQWDWCSSLCWASFISVADSFLDRIGPLGPLNCWHTPPTYTQMHTCTHTFPPSFLLYHATKNKSVVSFAYQSAWSK